LGNVEVSFGLFVFEELIWVARVFSVHETAVCPPSGRAKLYLKEGFIFLEEEE
jgi:hypothetical protein